MASLGEPSQLLLQGLAPVTGAGALQQEVVAALLVLQELQHGRAQAPCQHPQHEELDDQWDVVAQAPAHLLQMGDGIRQGWGWGPGAA